MKSKEKSSKSFKTVKLEDLYIKGANKVEQAVNETHATIISLLENNIEELATKIQTIKEIETQSDDIHDHIVKRLYAGDILVFSRADRLYLINEMDDVVDRCQDIALQAEIALSNTFNYPNSLVIHLISAMKNFQLMGGLIQEAILKIFDDFSATLTIVREIEKLKSDAHSSKNVFTKKLFEKDLTAKELFFFSKLMDIIWNGIFVTNKFADGIRRIIFKYKI